MFFITSFHHHSECFSVYHFIKFISSDTRYSAIKLSPYTVYILQLGNVYIVQLQYTNQRKHFYLNPIPTLWNSSPLSDVTLPPDVIKLKLLHFCLITLSTTLTLILIIPVLTISCVLVIYSSTSLFKPLCIVFHSVRVHCLNYFWQ